jgi:hypothetical protein
MTKTKVALLIRMVFLFWLIVSIALVGTTIATLLPLPDWRHGHERGIQLLTLTFNSFDSAGAVLEPTLNLKDLQWAVVWHARCFL